MRERAKWAAKWVGIYVICNLITVAFFYIAITVSISDRTSEDSTLLHFASVRAVEDYKDDYIRKLATDPNIVRCQIRHEDEDSADVTCSVFDEGKLALKKTYMYGTRGDTAGSLIGHETWDIEGAPAE